ncbi:MAG: MBL fold metallo-hydrolase, partial [bacterium]
TPLVPTIKSNLTGAADGAVSWTTDVKTRGAVRYGFTSGDYHQIAYPSTAGGADKAFVKSHTVPLLAAVAGVPIYIRRTDLTENRHFHAAVEETVVFAAVPDAQPTLAFTSIDVQFGDSHVLRLPSEDKILIIDAGNWYAGRRETAPEHVMLWLDDQGIDTIHYALVSHIHGDHWGGFLYNRGTPGIFASYEVETFLDVPAVSGNEDAYDDIIADVANRGITRQIIEPGMTDETDPEILGWDPLVNVMVLNAGSQPAWAGMSYSGDRINNDSVMLKISYGLVDLITGGDCEGEAETRVLTHYRSALDGVEFYKAHHHGRYDGSSLNFVNAMSPRVALIPVAYSAYNDGVDAAASATSQTLNRLAAVWADVYRFDDASPLGYENDNRTFWHTTLVTDGVSYEIHITESIWGGQP